MISSRFFKSVGSKSLGDLRLTSVWFRGIALEAPVSAHRAVAASTTPTWSGELSFASPETDYTGLHARSHSTVARSEWSGALSFASPEADFTATRSMASVAYQTPFKPRSIRREWSGQLSFASPESDWCAETILPTVQSAKHLPRTLQEALLEEKAAIVVTTVSSPHRIVHVNHAWEELCGFTKMEALNKSLSIIQGPDSNKELTDKTVNKLTSKKEAVDMYLVNYRKSGQPFLNHVSMGPLTLNDENRDVEFLVGILEEVRPDQVPLRMVA